LLALVNINEIIEKDNHIEDMRDSVLGHALSPTLNTLPFPCVTEDSPTSGHKDLQLGEHDKIFRWERGSIISYTIDISSFPSRTLALYALACLWITLEEWESHEIGLKFKFLPPGSAAVFSLVYRDDVEDVQSRKQGSVFARAFFPSAAPEERKLYVYKLSFTEPYRPFLINIMRHESGHIIGLRHWNAEWQEAYMRSVRFPANANNKASVMGPFRHLGEIHIHQNDVEHLKELYNHKAGFFVVHFKIVDVTP
jgi:hypothetical protein